jgi:hypothetical protein
MKYLIFLVKNIFNVIQENLVIPIFLENREKQNLLKKLNLVKLLVKRQKNLKDCLRNKSKNMKVQEI